MEPMLTACDAVAELVARMEEIVCHFLGNIVKDDDGAGGYKNAQRNQMLEGVYADYLGDGSPLSFLGEPAIVVNSFEGGPQSGEIWWVVSRTVGLVNFRSQVPEYSFGLAVNREGVSSADLPAAHVVPYSRLLYLRQIINLTRGEAEGHIELLLAKLDSVQQGE